MTNTEISIFKRLEQTPLGCLVWRGSKTQDGYGLVGWGGKKMLVHRVVYGLVNGEIPEGLEVSHSCHNPSCAEITHLRAKPHRFNILESVKNGRWKQSHRRNQYASW
jgi:hypothetical protein